jgi:hypothetical protein
MLPADPKLPPLPPPTCCISTAISSRASSWQLLPERIRVALLPPPLLLAAPADRDDDAIELELVAGSPPWPMRTTREAGVSHRSCSSHRIAAVLSSEDAPVRGGAGVGGGAVVGIGGAGMATAGAGSTVATTTTTSSSSSAAWQEKRPT